MPLLKLFSRTALVWSCCWLAACTPTAPLRAHDLPEPGEVSPRQVQ